MLTFTNKFASKLGKWGAKWSPAQELAQEIWCGNGASVELVQNTINQLKSIRKWVWLDPKYPSFIGDTADLSELIGVLEEALENHRTSEALAAFEETKTNYSQAFKQLAD